MFDTLSKLHLSNFKKGDSVQIKTCPRRYDGADAYKDYQDTIDDIELTEKFTNGTGSIIGKLKLMKL